MIVGKKGGDILKKNITILLFLLLITVGCNSTDTSSSKIVAKEFMESKAYEVINLTSELSLTFSVNAFRGTPIFKDLLVQPTTFNLSEYLDKEIQVLTYKVDNHPLGKADNKKVNLAIWVYDDEVIGGISSIATDELLYGGPHYVDGSKLEDFYPSFELRRDEVEKMLNELK